MDRRIRELINAKKDSDRANKRLRAAKEAVEKAESEYEKYRVIQDQEYISSMDKFYNKYLEENKSAINDIK